MHRFCRSCSHKETPPLPFAWSRICRCRPQIPPGLSSPQTLFPPQRKSNNARQACSAQSVTFPGSRAVPELTVAFLPYDGRCGAERILFRCGVLIGLSHLIARLSGVALEPSHMSARPPLSSCPWVRFQRSGPRTGPSLVSSGQLPQRKLGACTHTTRLLTTHTLLFTSWLVVRNKAKQQIRTARAACRAHLSGDSLGSDQPPSQSPSLCLRHQTCLPRTLALRRFATASAQSPRRWNARAAILFSRPPPLPPQGVTWRSLVSRRRPRKKELNVTLGVSRDTTTCVVAKNSLRRDRPR